MSLDYVRTGSATELGKYNQPLVPYPQRRVSALYIPNTHILVLPPTVLTLNFYHFTFFPKY